ncbi:MAG: phosphoribosyltransferase family protein [bacterium]
MRAESILAPPSASRISFTRISDTFTDEDVMSAINNFLNTRNATNMTIQPHARAVIKREAEALGCLNIEWILRSILGKASHQKVTDQEAFELIQNAAITPQMMIYPPIIRDGRYSADRIRKGVPSNAANLIFSPVIAEAMADELVRQLYSFDAVRSRLKQGTSDRKLTVIGKYLCGLVPGLLVALKLNLPYTVLSKKAFNFEVPKPKKIAMLKELHNPSGSTELYSYGAVYPDSDAIIVDDEITTGFTHPSVMRALRSVDVESLALAVFLQTMPSARAMIEKENIPYACLHQINLEQQEMPVKPEFMKFCKLQVNPRQRLCDQTNSPMPLDSMPYAARPINSELLESAVFVDNPLKGMSMELEPALVPGLSARLVAEIEQDVSIQKTRQRYYSNGKTLYILATAPSGLMAGTIASLATRIPMLGAVDRTEPLGLRHIINYIGENGFSSIISWLNPGDGVILVTGEITDGEEEQRIIRALRDNDVDVLSVTSVFENTYYDGRSVVENAIGNFDAPVSALQTYIYDEDLPNVNITERVWASLNYAVIQLEREIQKINPDAKIERISVTPCSLTRGIMMKNGDIDDMFVFVNGVSQFELNCMQEKFLSWLATEGLSFMDDNARPHLLSDDNREANNAKFCLDEQSLLCIYQYGKFLKRQSIAKTGNELVPMLYEKQIARIKLLYLLGEITEAHVTNLMRAEDSRDEFYRDLQQFISRREINSLTTAARELALTLDDLYCAENWEYVITEGREQEFKEALYELCKDGIVRIYNGKLILVWRAHMLTWSNRFYERQIRITSKSIDPAILLESIEERLTFAEDYSDLTFLSQQLKQKNPNRAEQAIRHVATLNPIPMHASEPISYIVINALSSPSIFVTAAAFETIRQRRDDFILELLGLLHTANRPSAKKKKSILIIKLLCAIINDDHHYADIVMQRMYEDVLSKYSFSFNIIVEEAVKHIGGVFQHITDDELKDIVYRNIYVRAHSHIEREARIASQALEKVTPYYDVSRLPKSIQEKHASPDAKILEHERQLLFEECERRRKSGTPITTVVADVDNTLVRFSRENPRALQTALSYWLNWLMQKGIPVLLTTGANYESNYAKCLGEQPQIPLRQKKNLHIFTDTSSYYNDQRREFPSLESVLRSNIQSKLANLGWRVIKDGVQPRMRFRQENPDLELTAKFISEIKRIYGKSLFITLTPSSLLKNMYELKIFTTTKADVFSASSLGEIDTHQCMILFDEPGPLRIDYPLAECGVGAFQVNVGEDVSDASAMHQLTTKNEDGARIAIEALAASVIMGLSGEEKENIWVNIEQDFINKSRLSGEEIRAIIMPVKSLVESDIRSSTMRRKPIPFADAYLESN